MFKFESPLGNLFNTVPTQRSSLAGVRLLALLGTLIVVGFLVWVLPVYAQDRSGDGNAVMDETPIWSADMTVVEYTSSSIGAASSDLFSNVGGTGNLKIKWLWSHIPDRDLRLAFNEGVSDADDYTLQVGDLSLDFPAGSSGQSSFKWTDVDVDWEDGQTVSVRIVSSATETPDDTPEPAANTAATGQPTISGTPQAGEKLTANTSSIADADGLTDPTYEYQWTADDTDISGATNAAYTLTDSDVGKVIKVKVSFTDDADNTESLTSEATAAVTARPNISATGAPYISGTATVRETLTADTSRITDEDELTSVSYSYQWLADDVNIEGATGSTYLLADDDAGKVIKVSVSFDDDRNNAESLTSEATGTIAATVPTQPLSLTVARGDQVQELDASWQAPSSNGGSEFTGYKVQWKESADNWETDADVTEAEMTGTTYTITGLTGAVEYAVRVIATNAEGNGPASADAKGTPAGGTSPQLNSGDSTSPTISSIAITSDTGDEESTWDDDGIYGIGDIISVTVTFSEDVTVTGSPRLELDIGGTAKPAEYKSAEGSKVVFSYTVAEGDSDDDGIAIGENKLTLNDGSIKDADDNAANLSHDALAAQEDHKVDGVRPTISLVSLGGSSGGVDRANIIGEGIHVAVVFSEEIVLDGSPQIALDLDSGHRPAHLKYILLPCPSLDTGGSIVLARNVPETEEPLTSGNYCLTSDTRGLTMVFSYTVARGDLDPDGLGIAANALSLNGATIRDTAGNDAVVTHEDVAESAAHLIDGVPPEVTSFEIISDPGEDDTYAAGDIIKVNVTFSEEFEVLWQSPRLRLDIGNKARMAYRVRRNVLDIQAGEVGYIMAFSYTVQDGDNDDDGISIPANALHRLWGELYDTNGNEVDLGHEAVASNAGHKVATTTTESTDNTPKTGLLTITGTLRVGETVTADMSNLTDDDGLDYATFSAHYDWGREGGGLYFEAMRNPSYVIAADDEGKKLQVEIQFYDDNGNLEYRTGEWSDPVEPRAPSNSAPTGLPTITGTPQVDQTLTANTSSIDDEDGLDSVSYSYQWIAGGTDIDDATGSSYTLTSSELGKTIQVRVSFTDDADNQESLTSEATAAVTRPPPRAPEMDGISIHDGMLRVLGGHLVLFDSVLVDSDVAAADVGSYISSFKVQWKSGSQGYDATRQAVLVPKPMTGNVPYYYNAYMPSYDITGLTNGVEYTVRVIATNAGGDGPPSQEQMAKPGAKSEEIWQYIEDEIVEEHEASHPWLRQTWDYLQNNNIPLIVWTLPSSAPNTNTFETYRDYSSGIQAKYVDSLNFSVSTVDGAEATKRETILINLAAIYTMTNGVSSSPGPLGIAYVYFRTADTLSLSGCWDSRLYLDVVVSLVLHDSLTGASDWNRCMARSEDATALAVVRSALSGQTPAWFADTYHDSDGNPELERLWSDVQIVGHTDVVGYQLRNSFGGYCDSAPDWGLRISRSLSPLYVFAGLDTLVNPWRDGGCVPTAPVSLTANDEGDGTASLSWKAPESNGGSLLSGYKIEWQSVAAEEGTTPQTKHVYFDDWSDEARPTEVSETIDGLTDGVEYTVRVLAYNPNGDGTAGEVTVGEAETSDTSNPNVSATGAPTISGTPQVGETLTANISSISDDDGLENVSFSYQWTAGGSDIDGATGSSYTLTSSEQGQIVQVRVSFTDDAGNQESLTSEGTDTVAATKPGVPGHLNVFPHDTGALDVYWEAPASDGGSAITGYKVQWKEAADSWDTAADVSEATVTGATYTITDLADNVEYSIRVMAVNDVGQGPPSAEATGTPQEEPIWSAILTVGVGENFAGYTTFLPSSNILGALSFDTITLDDAGYTVKALGVLDGTLILTVTPKMTAGFVLAAGTAEFASTDATTHEGDTIIQFRWSDPGLDWSEGEQVAVILTAPEDNIPATGAPTISGTAQVGETLTAVSSAIADEDGLTNVSYGYQWIRSDSGADTDIAGETDSTYILVLADKGKTIKVKVTFTDDDDNDEILTSVATVVVAAASNREAMGAPTISGTPQVGETLTADTSVVADADGLTNVSYRYRWIAGDTNIAGAGGSSYLLTSSEQGKTIQVRVTFTDDADNEETLTSAATVAVTAAANRAPTGLPTISGTPQVDETLTADTSSIRDEDGLENINYEYQWLIDDANIAGATGGTYKLTDDEEGKAVKVRVSFTDDADNAESLTSAATVAVAAKPNTSATGAPTITGTPQVDETLTVDTSAIIDDDGLNNVSYNYQWIAGGSDIDVVTGSTYTLTTSEQGKTIQVRVTFTDDADNEESLTSVATTEVAAAPVPLTVSLTSVPSTHDGTNPFTFNISFSEHFGLSYVTLKSHAFTVTEGSVKKAQRTDKPSNIPWRITVQPDGDGDVTIVLPETTDCAVQGAICTGDGRKLSNRLEFTVRGP